MRDENIDPNHVILPSGLHAIQYKNKNGTSRVEILTEDEYQQMTWWDIMKLKYFYNRVRPYQ